MLGAIIGDIAGSTFEFNNTFDYNFRLFPRGSSYTDDTICTVAVASAILGGRTHVEGYQQSLLKWCRRYPHPMGAYGGMFDKWLFAPGEHKPYMSYGNGAAMRVSPVGWAFDTEAEVIRQAFQTAEVTHNHREGLIGAAAVALAIFRLRIRTGLGRTAPAYAYVRPEPAAGDSSGRSESNSAGKSESGSSAKSSAKSDGSKGRNSSRADGPAQQTSSSRADGPAQQTASSRTDNSTAADTAGPGYQPLGQSAVSKVVEIIMRTCYGPKWRDSLPPKGRFDGTCQGTVPVAFDIISRSDSFEDAIRNAVSYGGDSDTLAAITGSIAEAVWPIPENLASTALCFLPDRLRAVVADFYNTYRR